MRIALIINYVLLAGLIVWVFLQSRTIAKLEGKLSPVIIPPVVTPPVTAPTDTTKVNDSINGTDLWDRLQNNAKEIKVDVILKNNA